MGVLRIGILLVFSLALVNCAKSKTGSSPAAPAIASNVAGQQIVCPVSGYYLYNGNNYPCIPGQTVTVGANVPAPTPAPTPTTPTPTPNPVPTGVPAQDSCVAWSTQYPGVTYVVAYYQGQYVCMRDDIAAYYGLAVY